MVADVVETPRLAQMHGPSAFQNDQTSSSSEIADAPEAGLNSLPSCQACRRLLPQNPLVEQRPVDLVDGGVRPSDRPCDTAVDGGHGEVPAQQRIIGIRLAARRDHAGAK